jgi:hypothetical protein
MALNFPAAAIRNQQQRVATRRFSPHRSLSGQLQSVVQRN